MIQYTLKKFYKSIFPLFKIVLHVLKFSLFSYLAMVIFQLVNELRNEQNHLESMILANLVEGTYSFKSEINQNTYYDVIMM